MVLILFKIVLFFELFLLRRIELFPPAEVSLTLGAFMGEQVSFACLPMHYLAVFADFESLFYSFV
jgi:hypothetical protein